LEKSETFRAIYRRLDADRDVRLTIRDAYDPQRVGLGANQFILGETKSGTIRFNDIGVKQANYDLRSRDPTSSGA
jgi:hypothetical protein